MVTDFKCRFCERAVQETIHCKKLPDGYYVDYYLVWTGKLSPIIMKNPRDEREILQFFKLEKAYPVVACRGCFEKTEVREELEKAFTEVPEAKIEDEDEEEKL